ncbi:hypothetical protein HPB49_000915 [Dermacentor silvarum]|uniref:Uncharacterized protein n=1 Tax=Dermacentor silvarum TaxID=543639 RepID=A0ACB8D9M2_DERSI|nr:hypothetical protein HPB49_000915 [Dermacentor silvarum]
MGKGHKRKLQSTADIGNSGNRVHSADSGHRKWGQVTVVAAGAALSLILAVTALLVSRRYKLQRNPPGNQEAVFCCKEEAEMIIADLNQSGNACEDFYEYVCSRAEQLDSGFVPPSLKVTMAWKIIEVTHMAQAGGVRQRILLALRRVLASWLWLPHDEQIADFTVAILKMGNVSATMNALDILRFFALMSLKYSLWSVTSFEAYPVNSNLVTTVRVETYTGCFLDTDNIDLIALALLKFNDHTNATVNASDVLNFAQKVNNTDFGTGELDTERFNINTVPIRGISLVEWDALLKEFVFATLPNVTTLLVSAADKFQDFIDLFASSANQPAAIAYVTICSAIHSAQYLRTSVDHRIAQETSSTVHQALGVCRVNDLAKTEAVWSESLDLRIRELFSLMRKKVYLEAISANMLIENAESVPIVRRLDNLRLMLPIEINNAASNLTIPPMSGSFGLDLLATRAHNFDIKRIETELNMPYPAEIAMPDVVRRQNVIYISNNLYLFLDPFTSRDGVLDLATLGVGLATEIWSFLLEEAESEGTGQFVKSHYRCFSETYFKGTSEDGTWRRAFYTALGLASAASAGRTKDWGDIFNQNNTLISKARLMYLYWVHNQCTASYGKMFGFAINLALRNSQLFTEAFACAPNASMSQRPACLMVQA